jgi:hypothetical protein
VSAGKRQDWLLWGQLACALVATAHAEYTLVTALGQHMIVAGAVTGALDLYVVRALQKHKDVLPAVLVMVAANVVSVLIGAHVVPVHWAVFAAVGALAPALVWRGHVLRVHDAEASGAVKVPEVQPVAPVLDYGWTAPETEVHWVGDVLAKEVHPDPCQLSEPIMRPLDDECGECGGRWGDHPGVQRKLAERVQLGAPVPAGTIALSAEDAVYLPTAQAYLNECDGAGTVRGLKRYASVGQARAERLLAYLKEES